MAKRRTRKCNSFRKRKEKKKDINKQEDMIIENKHNVRNKNKMSQINPFG